MSVRIAVRDALGAYPVIDGFFRRVIWSRIHFSEMEQHFLNDLPANSIDVAIDVGAALGPYSWILNRKARQVFAFEPGEKHGHFLEVNVAGTRVKLVRAAVGDTFKTVHMYTPGSDTHALHSATLSQSNPVAAHSNVIIRKVDQVTLDGLFENKLGEDRSVDVLKVDVEGYENAVFRGAVALLQIHHPLVICEIEARHDPAYRKTFELLRSLGYKSFIFRAGGYRLFEGDNILEFQSDEALQERLSRHYDPVTNAYLNNFVFQHPLSRLKVA